MRRRRLRLVALAAALPLLAQCGDQAGPPAPPAPQPGTFVVSVVSPATDGALLLQVTGPDLEPPEALAPGVELHWRALSPNELRIAVFGTIAGGPLFEIPTADTNTVNQLAATIMDVAGPDHRLRDNLSPYSITLQTSVSR